MISESTIEQVIGQFENPAHDFEKTIREFGGRQPAILSFLMSDTEGALTEDERDFMLYLGAVIWKAVETQQPDLLKITPEELAEAEEQNWSLLEKTSARRFRERMDVFFENYPQEDLLAFVEDALTSDQEDEDEINITSEGREPMFVALKTVIDVLTAEG